jgi:predicted Na+-dependent transporter
MIMLTVVAAILAGKLSPYSIQPLTPYMLYFIAAMIWAMSVTIKLSDLSLTFKKPSLIIWGLVANFIFLPFLCYVLAISLMSRYPLYAAGFILMGTAPTAGMSVVWTSLLGGIVALALVLDALTDILAILTMPSLTGILAGTYVSVDVLGMLNTLILVVIVPLALGMTTRNILERWSHERAKHYLPLFPPIGAIMAMIMMFIMVAVNIPTIPATQDILLVLIAPALLFFPIAFGGIHLFCKKILRLAEKESVTIVYCSAMKHLPLAMGVAFVSLGQQAALPITVAAVFQTLNASLFYRIFQARARLASGCTSEISPVHNVHRTLAGTGLGKQVSRRMLTIGLGYCNDCGMSRTCHDDLFRQG